MRLWGGESQGVVRAGDVPGPPSCLGSLILQAWDPTLLLPLLLLTTTQHHCWSGYFSVQKPTGLVPLPSSLLWPSTTWPHYTQHNLLSSHCPSSHRSHRHTHTQHPAPLQPLLLHLPNPEPAPSVYLAKPSQPEPRSISKNPS